MFERIVIRSSSESKTLTPGDLAEALLYYQHVHIVIGYGLLQSLTTSLGADTFLSVLCRPNVTATYCPETIGVRTNTTNGVESHNLAAFQLIEEGKKEPAALYHFQSTFRKSGFTQSKAKKMARKFKNEITIASFTGDHFAVGGLPALAKSDIFDPNYLEEAARETIGVIAPGYQLPNNFIFKAIPNDNGFFLQTNLETEKISAIQSYTDGKITPAYLVSHVSDARTDLTLAAHYGADFQTSNLTSRIMRIKYAHILKFVDRGISERDAFQEVLLGQKRALKEAIDSGERSFDEFLTLLDEAQKFRNWIGGLNPDEKVIKAYINEIERKGWIDKLPVRAARFVFGTSVGLVDPTFGVSTSIADSFLLEKLMGGWRPHHFINQQLRPFVSDQN